MSIQKAKEKFVYQLQKELGYDYQGGIIDIDAINTHGRAFSPMGVIFFREFYDNQMKKDGLFHAVLCNCADDEATLFVAITDKIYRIDEQAEPLPGGGETGYKMNFVCSISPDEMRAICDKNPPSYHEINGEETILVYRRETEPDLIVKGQVVRWRQSAGPLIVTDSMHTGVEVVLWAGIQAIRKADFIALEKQFEKLAKSGEVVPYAIQKSKVA